MSIDKDYAFGPVFHVQERIFELIIYVKRSSVERGHRREISFCYFSPFGLLFQPKNNMNSIKLLVYLLNDGTDLL